MLVYPGVTQWLTSLDERPGRAGGVTYSNLAPIFAEEEWLTINEISAFKTGKALRDATEGKIRQGTATRLVEWAIEDCKAVTKASKRAKKVTDST